MDNQNSIPPQTNQPTNPPIVSQPITPPPTPVYVVQQPQDQNKTIVTILLLIFFYPLGLILMWTWTTWQTAVKVLVSCFGCLGCLGTVIIIPLIAAGMLSTVNPQLQIQRAECVKQCEVSASQSACIDQCVQDSQQNEETPFQEDSPIPEITPISQ